jgi:hypothetical protein
MSGELWPENYIGRKQTFTKPNAVGATCESQTIPTEWIVRHAA